MRERVPYAVLPAVYYELLEKTPSVSDMTRIGHTISLEGFVWADKQVDAILKIQFPLLEDPREASRGLITLSKAVVLLDWMETATRLPKGATKPALFPESCLGYGAYLTVKSAELVLEIYYPDGREFVLQAKRLPRSDVYRIY